MLTYNLDKNTNSHSNGGLFFWAGQKYRKYSKATLISSNYFYWSFNKFCKYKKFNFWYEYWQ